MARAHEPGDAPVLVSEKHKVRDLSHAARAAGLRAGMSTREARTLVPDLITYDAAPDLYEAPRKAWLDLARAFTDAIEATAPDQAFLDLSRHPDPEDVARALLDEIERKLGYETVAGLSPTKWVAQTLAGPRLRVMPLPGLALMKEPVSILTPLEPKTRERLGFLGYKKVKDVQGLSLNILRQQFGGEAMRIHLAANGALSEPVFTNYPLPSVVGSRSLAGGCADLEMLRFAITRLCATLVAELGTLQLEANQMRLILSFEETEKDLKTTFAKPMRSASSLVTSLIRTIEGLGLEEPIYRITVHLLDLSPARLRQRTLTGMHYTDNGQAEDALEPLRQKFGSYSIHLGKEHVVPRREELLRTWARATGWA